jgi:hypothetical protein
VITARLQRLLEVALGDGRQNALDGTIHCEALLASVDAGGLAAKSTGAAGAQPRTASSRSVPRSA